MIKPYVCVTGPLTKTEIELCINAFEEAGFGMERSHIPALGFLFSYKNLYNIPPKKGKVAHSRYQQAEFLKERIKLTNGKIFPVIHFYTKNRERLAEQIKQLFSEFYAEENLYESNTCRAIQINRPWPKISEIEKIIGMFPEMKIILQLSKKILTESQKIVDKLKDYRGLISYALIDPSGGKGKNLDIEKAVEIYNTCTFHLQDVGLGFAGGFNDKNIQQNIRLLEQGIGHHNFSIDAEQGLRDRIQTNEKLLLDDINTKKVRSYVKECAEALAFRI